MLTLNPASLRATFGDAAATAATGGSAPVASNDPAGFASLLRQTRVAPVPPPAPPPAPAPVPATSADAQATHEPTPANEARETEAAQESDAARRTRALLKGKPRGADGANVAPRDAKPAADARDATRPEAGDKTATGACNGACSRAETRPTTAEAPIDPSVMQWLAGLQRAAGQTDAGDKTTAGDADATATTSRGAAKGLRAAGLKADAELKDKTAQDAAQGPAQLADAASANPFAAALAEPRAGERPALPPTRAAEGTKDIAAAAAGALAPAPTPGNDAATPLAVPIASAVTAPDFARELGLRLSVLAKDGVQSAELHLNPADMGPVSVQIVMDGTQARVDFGADVAATRRAIEAGLPGLASALADAGFTLAGGGVSQHAGGRSGGGGNDAGSSGGERRRGIVADDEVKRVASAARRIVAKGGIDLFA